MPIGLNVHLKDYGGREFGGEYIVGKITPDQGRLMVLLEYCGTKTSKRLTMAWLDIDQDVVAEMVKVLSASETNLG